MSFFRWIFTPIAAIFRFINRYFKTVVFLTIVAFLIFGGENRRTDSANLVQIDVKGAIFDTQAVLEQIQDAKNDENIKGVLLFIDSPGGALAPSVELNMAVKNLRAKKPVIAYASGSMTSGSYYAGTNATRILANPGSFIGSIGVIMQGADVSELANKLGVAPQTVKAGEFKEAGTFARKWNDAERAQLQALVDRTYEMFVADVAAARNLDANKSEIWANARVFLAAEAKNAGLIDGVSDYYSARAELERLSGVSKPVWKKKPVYEKLFENAIQRGVDSFVQAVFGAGVK